MPRSEAIEPVRSYYEHQYLAAMGNANPKRSRLGVQYWLKKAGVASTTAFRDDDDEGEGLQYAWDRSDRPGREPGVFMTVWIERIQLDAHAGKPIWYCREWLDTKTIDFGQARDKNQEERAINRKRLLKQCHNDGKAFHALLIENKLTIDEIRNARSAKAGIATALEDDVRWRVHTWNEPSGYSLLVRGEVPADWRPGKTPEVDLVSEAIKEARIVFPDQAHRDAVEKAGISAVTEELKATRRMVSREPENLGYDLDAYSLQDNQVKEKIEVKATAGPKEQFFLSRNEARCAKQDPLWRLAIVTSALTNPQVFIYRWTEAQDTFDFEPLVWFASGKSD